MEKIENIELEIREVTPDDFDILTDINQICFPEQSRWKITRSNIRKWWSTLLNSQSCEIWVGSVSGQVIGYIVFAFNRIKYQNLWEKKHFTIFDYLHMFILNPKKLINKIFEKLKRNKNTKTRKTELSENENSLNIYEEIRKISAKSNPWCGPVAVLPEMRGKGISVKLWEHCFQRAKSLGYKEIYGAVEKRNLMSRVMIAIVGFEVTQEVAHLLFYKKNLENNNVNELIAHDK